MPLVKTMTTTVICDFCGAADVHVAGTRAPLAVEYFFDRHWDIIPTGPTDQDTTVACPRCAPILATLTTSLTRGLATAEAHR
jgi:ribosomal protein S27E